MANPVNTAKPVSVLHDIYEWSIGRPAWQCDALRRIITKGTLDGIDLAELEKLCRQEKNATGGDGKPLTAIPLADTHLPAGPNSQDSVSLEYMSDMTGVNRLPSGQKVTFGQSPGLTIIYGDNGTGKSGYVRVIKKACRTRGAPPVIRPDVFLQTPPKPSCKLGIKAAGKGSEVIWTDGIDSDKILGNVFVFDSAAASHYLEADGPASFTPHGLDILPKLSKTADFIAARIKQDIGALEREIVLDKAALAKHANTNVGAALAKLDAKTSLSGIMLLAELSETETKRLLELRSLLGSDPKKKARETRASKNRIEAFKTQLEHSVNLLSAGKIKELKESIENMAATEQAAKTSAETSFSTGVLAGTGSDLWRAMWEAAKTFSITSAYPGAQFPKTGNEDRCVLCQRPFNDDAAAVELAKSFVKFCDADVQRAAKLSREKFNELKKVFNQSDALKSDYEKIASDLAGLSAVEIKILSDFVESADDCLATVKKSIKTEIWTSLNDLTVVPTSILTNLIDVLEKRAKREESAEDPTARQKLQKECDELIAKEWLKSSKKEVENQIARYQQVEVLTERLNDTKTNAITSKNSSLTKELITDAYCQKFAEEVKAMGVRTVKVNLEETGNSKGEKKFGVRLVGANGGIGLQEIISEGEQRCIALASFLSELSQSSHQSALVFDDPVSSLDHFYRNKIAARLVKEAKVRQVIIFTHDTVFLNDLVSEADEAQAAYSTYYLRWDAKQPGWLEAGLPWDYEAPQVRLKKISLEQKALEKIWQPFPDDKLKKQMRDVYGDIRATVEGIIEKFVFADVVFRFRSHIKVGKLNSVVGFSKAENEEIQRIHKKCSEIINAHLAAAGKQAPMPDPPELAKDIDDTQKLLDSIRARHKPAKATP